MKRSRIVPACSAFLFLAASTLAAQADAHQTIYRGYSYPSGTNGLYSSGTMTCNTGAPDYDADCTNGDSISIKWFVKTRTTAQADIEYKTPLNVNLSYGAHWTCEEVLYCSDGSAPSTYFVDGPCGWTVCPTGASASFVGIYLGIQNHPL